MLSQDKRCMSTFAATPGCTRRWATDCISGDSRADKPLILIQPLISRVPAADLTTVAWRRARIQVTAMADSQPEAEAAARAVFDAVEGYTGMMAGALEVLLATVESDRQVEQEGIDEIYHHVDVMITYKE